MRRVTHTFCRLVKEYMHMATLMFTTLPIICFDSDRSTMLAVRNSEDLYYQIPVKTDGYIVIVDPLECMDGEYVFSQNTKSHS